MATLDADLDLGRAAALHDGLGHPARVAILRVLRRRNALALRELRPLVAELWRPLDARTLQHHAHKMMIAGIIDLEARDGVETAVLQLDVALRLRPAGAG